MTKFSALLLVTCLLGACTGSSAGADDSEKISRSEAQELLVNRNWMDVWPNSAEEKLHVLRFVPDMGGGVYQDRTLFKGTFELFSFEATGDKIRFDLHHTGDRKVVGYAIETVNGPEPFDLKLTLRGSPRGPSVYYGRRAETVTDLGPFVAEPLRVLLREGARDEPAWGR